MSNAAPALVQSELVLGRYRPLRPLGSGGSGSVWLARDEQNGLDVALKIVPREGKAASRAEREAEAAARLRHPSCQRAYGFGRDSQHVYIAYEYVPGRTFREALRSGELDDDSTIEACAQILEALAHAHARGIVHRDVKPSNVLLAEGRDVSVRVLDFGLAQIQQAETLTAQGDVPGTLAYIAPERLAGALTTEAADVWAVGLMLWEALAGRHPFWRSSLLETARAIEAGAPRLETVRPDLPKPLLAAVNGALDLDPARRPSAAVLAETVRLAARKRRVRKGGGQTLAVPAVVPRLVPALLAATVAGWTAWTLPFFPSGWPLGLAALAAAASIVNARLGLAFALAVPVLPLGNLALGAAVVYALAAAGLLVAMWREPKHGLLFSLGAVLAPIAGSRPLPARRSGSELTRATGCAGRGSRAGGRNRGWDPRSAAALRRCSSARPGDRCERRSAHGSGGDLGRPALEAHACHRDRRPCHRRGPAPSGPYPGALGDRRARGGVPGCGLAPGAGSGCCPARGGRVGHLPGGSGALASLAGYSLAMVLRAIEQKIESLFEGIFGRAFRTNVQPVELARKLAKEMDEHRTVSVSRVYVPNEYTVYLSPGDREQFSSYEDNLKSELQEYLSEHSRREDYALLSPVRVLMETDSDLDVGEFGIATRMVQPERRRAASGEPEGDVAPGATMIYKPETPVATQAVSAEELGVEPELVTLSFDGTRYEVKQRRVVIGRSRDCDIQLADTNVSRRHAELRQEGASYWIVDLGSTNGIEVNGKRVKRAKLTDGDTITLGSTEVAFSQDST